jgi:aspartate aminotransferase-like enzyme
VDCISSLGATPLDLREVYLATGTSGKSLGSYAGVAILFADPQAAARLEHNNVPTYLDAGAALRTKGPCFTFPSPMLLALDAALREYETPERAASVYARYRELGTLIRNRLRGLGLTPLAAAEDSASPVITTFAPPEDKSAMRFVARCRKLGYAIGGESGYLAQRRFVQIATMGAVTRPQIEPLFDKLQEWLAGKAVLAAR